MFSFNDISKSNLEHKNDILWLANKIIYHNPTRNYHFKGDIKSLQTLPPHKTLFKLPPHKGLPIGNLTSQFFANVYMNKFDNFVKRELKVQKYIRYVDDFVLFDDDKQKLQNHKQVIENYLNTYLGLTLREDSRLRKNGEGLDFLGYIIRPHYLLVRNRVVNNFKFKKAKYLEKYEASHCECNEAIHKNKPRSDPMSFEQIKRFLSVQSSFVSHSKHANSYNLIKKVGIIDEKQDTYPTRISW